MGKVPDYLQKAQTNYREKRDRINIYVEKGLKEEVRKRTKLSITQLIEDFLKDFIKSHDPIEK